VHRLALRAESHVRPPLARRSDSADRTDNLATCHDESHVEALRRNEDREFGTAGVRAVKFKSSALTPTGPVYRDEGVFSLS